MWFKKIYYIAGFHCVLEHVPIQTGCKMFPLALTNVMGESNTHSQHSFFCISFASCSTKFCLSYSDKELLEREDRGESQQEILRRIAKELPIYTRTNSGGRSSAACGTITCGHQPHSIKWQHTRTGLWFFLLWVNSTRTNVMRLNYFCFPIFFPICIFPFVLMNHVHREISPIFIIK